MGRIATSFKYRNFARDSGLKVKKKIVTNTLVYISYKIKQEK